MASDEIEGVSGIRSFIGTFEEETDRTLIAIYRFEKGISENQLIDMAQIMTVEFDDKDIKIGDNIETQVMDSGSFIMFGLNKTNVNADYIGDLYRVGKDMSCYEDFIISTATVEDISRLG